VDQVHNLIQPKEVSYKYNDGEKEVEKKFFISKFPAIAGREIVSKYPLSNLPKLGDYDISVDAMLKLMSYVTAVTVDEVQVPLTTQALIDNHIPDWEVLVRLEAAMLEYNCSFFGNGKALISLETLKKQAVKLISKTWMEWSEQSSPKRQRHSKN